MLVNFKLTQGLAAMMSSMTLKMNELGPQPKLVRASP